MAEIKKRAIEAGLHDGVIAETREDECYSILSFLDTLEVKEVDLDKEVTSYILDNTRDGYFRADIHDVAEHFYELGLKAQKGE